MASEAILLAPLIRIAQLPRGGEVIHGEPSGDRDTAIGMARQALRKYTGELSVDSAIESAKRKVLEVENS